VEIGKKIPEKNFKNGNVKISRHMNTFFLKLHVTIVMDPPLGGSKRGGGHFSLGIPEEKGPPLPFPIPPRGDPWYRPIFFVRNLTYSCTLCTVLLTRSYVNTF